MADDRTTLGEKYFQTVRYTDEELSGMSENRKRINNLSIAQWCGEWDRLTKRLRLALGYSEK